MIKSQLAKGLLFGLCMSALASGTAFAQSGEGSSPASKGAVVSDELNSLYAKQKDIDQYVFVDHAKELQDKEILVNYTGVVDNYVEIGISPYNDDNANYLYNIFGKDEVKVVAFDESVLYTTTVATTDVGVAEPASTDVTSTLASPDSSVSSNVAGPTNETKVYKGTDASTQAKTDGAAVSNNSEIYETLAADSNVNEEVQPLSATEETVAVKRDAAAQEDNEGVSAPMAILAIAGGAAVIGGVVLTAKKKEK